MMWLMESVKTKFVEKGSTFPDNWLQRLAGADIFCWNYGFKIGSNNMITMVGGFLDDDAIITLYQSSCIFP